MAEKPIIAISGASGFIGSYLSNYFQNRGYKVIALVREIIDNDKENLIYRQFDLSAPPVSLDLAGAETLIHCAYVKNKADADTANFKGTEFLYNLSKSADVKKFIFLSSLSAHENAVSHYGRTKFQLESVLNPEKDLILKPGLVLGNGGLFGSIFRIVRQTRILPLIDAGKQKLQGIDIRDLVECIRIGIENDIIGTYVLVADESLTLYDMTRLIAKHLKKKIWFVSLPYGLIDAVLYVFDILHFPFPVNRENLLGLRQNTIWKTGDCLRVFGVQPRSFAQTIREMSS